MRELVFFTYAKGVCRRGKNLIYFLFFTLLFCSCVGLRNSSPQSDQAHNSRNALDWDGTYAGNLPNFDKNAVQTFLSLTRDNRFELRTNLSDNTADTSILQKGIFSWNKLGNQISLISDDGNYKADFAVGENILIALKNKNLTDKVKIDQKNILSKTATEIYERYWKLINMEGKTIVVDSNFNSEPYLIFKAHTNRMIGNGSCNMISARFNLYGNNKISIQAPAATLMACKSREIEQNLFNTLIRVNSFRINQDQLTLIDANNKILAVFKEVLLY